MHPRQSASFLAVLGTVLFLVLVFMAAGEVNGHAGLVLIVTVAAGGAWAAGRKLPVPPPALPSAKPERPPLPDDVLDNLPVAVVLVDDNRRVCTANRVAREIFDSHMVGHDLSKTLRHPDVLAAADAVLAGATPLGKEIELPVPVRRIFSVDAAALAGGVEPDCARAALIFHEITALKQAEQTQADFVANVSHELRSPLSALIGFIETLQGPARGDHEARARFLDIMRAEAERMARLVNDLLSLSRVEINEHVPPRGRVDLELLLGNVTEILAVRARARKMTIALDCHGALPAVVGDYDQLMQVFQNLIDNALKYGLPGTAVEVAARSVDRIPDRGGAGVAVSVRDHGPGIPAEHLPRLTERFYRVDKARSRNLGGTGLGLAIVKHIVNRHRGRIDIDSTEGDGATFSVYLPGSGPQAVDSPGERGAGAARAVTKP